MRVLLTGGAGFIGSHVADHLLARGHEVAVVDDLSSGKRENVPEGTVFFERDIPRVLGWRPQTKLTAGLEETLSFFGTPQDSLR
jgi:nucleoside-diphosphate-sugar epimerase